MKNKKTRDGWRTPEKILSIVRDVLGVDYDDPCPADFNGEPEKDGLIRAWGKNCFINPPYSQGSLVKWAAKALAERMGKKDEVSFIWLLNYGCTLNRRVIFSESSLFCIPFNRIEFMPPSTEIEATSNNRD